MPSSVQRVQAPTSTTAATSAATTPPAQGQAPQRSHLGNYLPPPMGDRTVWKPTAAPNRTVPIVATTTTTPSYRYGPPLPPPGLVSNARETPSLGIEASSAKAGQGGHLSNSSTGPWNGHVHHQQTPNINQAVTQSAMYSTVPQGPIAGFDRPHSAVSHQQHQQFASASPPVLSPPPPHLAVSPATAGAPPLESTSIAVGGVPYRPPYQTEAGGGLVQRPSISDSPGSNINSTAAVPALAPFGSPHMAAASSFPSSPTSSCREQQQGSATMVSPHQTQNAVPSLPTSMSNATAAASGTDAVAGAVAESSLRTSVPPSGDTNVNEGAITSRPTSSATTGPTTLLLVQERRKEEDKETGAACSQDAKEKIMQRPVEVPPTVTKRCATKTSRFLQLYWYY